MNSMTDSENNIETTEVNETTEVAGTPEATETPEVSTEVVEASESPGEATEATTEEAPEITQDEGVTPEIAGEEPQTREGMNWFVLRVASNKEDYVKPHSTAKLRSKQCNILLVASWCQLKKQKPFPKQEKRKSPKQNSIPATSLLR